MALIQSASTILLAFISSIKPLLRTGKLTLCIPSWGITELPLVPTGLSDAHNRAISELEFIVVFATATPNIKDGSGVSVTLREEEFCSSVFGVWVSAKAEANCSTGRDGGVGDNVGDESVGASEVTSRIKVSGRNNAN